MITTHGWGGWNICTGGWGGMLELIQEIIWSLERLRMSLLEKIVLQLNEDIGANTIATKLDLSYTVEKYDEVLLSLRKRIESLENRISTIRQNLNQNNPG